MYWVGESVLTITGNYEEEKIKVELKMEGLRGTYITNCESRKKREKRDSVEFEQKE